MIDKARMRERGALGAYLLGHSPVDRSLLRVLGMTTDAFAALAVAQPDDAAVLTALRARSIDEARLRRWSDRFEQTFKAAIPIWDLDEGYTKPSPVVRAAFALFRPIELPLMALVHKVLKAP